MRDGSEGHAISLIALLDVEVATVKIQKPVNAILAFSHLTQPINATI